MGKAGFLLAFLALAIVVGCCASLETRRPYQHRSRRTRSHNDVLLERRSRAKEGAKAGTVCGGKLKCPFESAVCCESVEGQADACCPSDYKCNPHEGRATTCVLDRKKAGSRRSLDPKVQKWIEQARKNKQPVVEVSLREGKGDEGKPSASSSPAAEASSSPNQEGKSDSKSNSNPADQTINNRSPATADNAPYTQDKIQKMIADSVSKAVADATQQNKNNNNSDNKQPQTAKQEGQPSSSSPDNNNNNNSNNGDKKNSADDSAIPKSEQDQEAKASSTDASPSSDNNNNSSNGSKKPSKNGWRPKQNIIIVKNINVLTHGIRPSSSGSDSDTKAPSTATTDKVPKSKGGDDTMPSDNGP